MRPARVPATDGIRGSAATVGSETTARNEPRGKQAIVPLAEHEAMVGTARHSGASALVVGTSARREIAGTPGIATQARGRTARLVATAPNGAAAVTERAVGFVTLAVAGEVALTGGTTSEVAVHARTTTETRPHRSTCHG